MGTVRKEVAEIAAPRLVSNQPDYESREVIETIKQTVAKGATDAEFKMFLEICKGTGLNPFLKEIWCAVPMKDGQRSQYGQVLIMAARDGYLRVANEHPMFDGIETRVERDEATKIPVKAVCSVWRKDRSRPTICEAYFNEYYKPGYGGKPSVWDTYKSAMIGKVAEVLALKRSFSINGVVTEEEIGSLEYQQQDPRGTKEAAKEVAERKIAEMKQSKPTVTIPAEIHGEVMGDTQRDDLIEGIKDELKRICPAPATGEMQQLLKDNFGVAKWSEVVKAPITIMSEGLEKLKAIVIEEPLWDAKYAMLKAFKEQKERLVREAGDTDTGEEAYYSVLKEFGVEKSDQFKTMADGQKCYAVMVGRHIEVAV